MSARAHIRMAADERMRGELAQAARQAQQRAALEAGSGDWRFFLGTCDVCGGSISLIHSFSQDGIIDYGIDGEASTARMYTWIHHTAGPTPDCGRYASRVFEVCRECYLAATTSGA